MNLIPIAKSSNISHVGWDNGTLEVHFKDGGQYQYGGVPQDTFHKLLSAESKGGFFHRAINGKFQTQNLKPTPANITT